MHFVYIADNQQQNEYFNDDIGGNNDTQDNEDGNGDDDIPYIIRIRGLPWNTTKQEICDFFEGVNIVNGENGIHLITLATNNSKPLGEAYIELASNDDLQLAHTFHKKNLGTRYIEGNSFDHSAKASHFGAKIFIMLLLFSVRGRIR